MELQRTELSDKKVRSIGKENEEKEKFSIQMETDEMKKEKINNHKGAKKFRKLPQTLKRNRQPLKEIQENKVIIQGKRNIQIKDKDMEEVEEEEQLQKRSRGGSKIDREITMQEGEKAIPNWAPNLQ